MAASSFLSIDPGGNKCLLCQIVIKKNEKFQALGSQGWEKFKTLAKDWSDIVIDIEDKRFLFGEVYKQVQHANEPFGKVHKSCRTEFSTKLPAYQRNNSQNITDQNVVDFDQSDSDSKIRLRQRSTKQEQSKRECFICAQRTATDCNTYAEGGLGRCELKTSQARLLERQKIFLADTSHRFHEAARRLERLQGGQSFDIFAIDVYYHKPCYVKFAINPLPSTKNDEEIEQKKADIMSDFFRAVRIKILRKKEAYLLHHLLGDVELFSEENDMDPIVTSTSTLKRKLVAEFGDQIEFFPVGKYIIVHSCTVNPCEYSVATLKGHCLKDEDFVRSFGNFIRKKIKQRNYESLPQSPDALIENFDNGPLPELYNVIYATMYPNITLNEHGYARTESANVAPKIWSTAMDWESLISRGEHANEQQQPNLGDELNTNEFELQQDIPHYSLGQRKEPPRFPQDMDQQLLANLVAIRKSPSAELLETTIELESFTDIFSKMTSNVGGTERKMT
eukprot:gene2888-3341_t